MSHPNPFIYFLDTQMTRRKGKKKVTEWACSLCLCLCHYLVYGCTRL